MTASTASRGDQYALPVQFLVIVRLQAETIVMSIAKSKGHSAVVKLAVKLLAEHQKFHLRSRVDGVEVV